MPYNITKKTLALIPEQGKTKVIETDRCFTTKEVPLDIVSRNCMENGSTLEGRQKASAYIIGSKYKPPIIINDTTKFILIPTHSVRNEYCSWLVLQNIVNYFPNPHRGTSIEFKNNQLIDISQSFTIFDKQVLRATRLESALRGRNSKKKL